MIRALIFDFDGLILDTEMVDYLSWREMYAAHGVELPLGAWQESIGTIGRFDPYAELERLLGRPIEREQVRAARRQRDDELLASLEVMPGVLDALAQARRHGLRTAVASSSDHAWVDPHLRRLGLWEAFEVVRCRDDVGDRPKPDPAVYQAVLDHLGVAPDATVAFEDSPHGVAAARAAGIYAIAVPNEMTRPLDFSAAHHQLASLADLSFPELLNGRWGRQAG